MTPESGVPFLRPPGKHPGGDAILRKFSGKDASKVLGFMVGKVISLQKITHIR